MSSEQRKAPVALITGAAGGVGRATALRFAKDGYALVISDISQERVDTLAKEIHQEFPETEVLPAACDIASPRSIADLREATSKWTTKIDVLALIAGVVQDAVPVTEMSVEQWDTVHAANLRGVFLCSREFIPIMPRNSGASIITVASWWGRSGQGFFSAYASSKAGVVNFTQSLAAELAGYGIRANIVAPGNIDTGMHRKALEVEAEQRRISFDEMKAIEWGKIPLGYAGPPSSVADAIAFLASDQSSYMTGATLDVNGGVMFN